MEMDNVTRQITDISKKYKIEKLVLFGSRARGDHSPVSDYDIAVFGKHLSTLDRACFCADVDEVETLKKIDIVFVDDSATDALIKNITREGVILAFTETARVNVLLREGIHDYEFRQAAYSKHTANRSRLCYRTNSPLRVKGKRG